MESLDLTDVSLMMSSDTQYAVIEIAHEGSVIDSVRPLDLRNWLDKVAPSKQITLKEALEALVSFNCDNNADGYFHCNKCSHVKRRFCSIQSEIESEKGNFIEDFIKYVEALCQKNHG